MSPRCKCGHAASSHERPGFEPQCVNPGCTCLNYRPAAAEVLPVSPVTVSAAPIVDAPHVSRLPPQGIDALIHEGQRVQNVRIRKIAERAQKAVDKLRTELDAYRATAATLEEIAALERKLAAAKANLKRPSKALRSAPEPAEKPADKAAYPCPDCGRGFARPQALGSHRHQLHGYRREAAS